MKFEQYIKESDIIKQYYNIGGIGELNESSFNRILSMLNDKSNEFLIITAFKPYFTKKQNLKRNNQLIKELRTKLNNVKIGAYKLVGHWKECNKHVNDLQQKCKEANGKMVDSLEESWFILFPDGVNDKVFNIITEISKKYEQEAFILRKDKIKLYGNDGTVYKTFSTNTGKEALVTSFKELLGVQGYTQWKKDRTQGKNRNLVFEKFYGVRPTTNFGKQLFNELQINY